MKIRRSRAPAGQGGHPPIDDIGELETSRGGAFLARLTVAPVLLATCWLAVSLPLMMAGVFTPWASVPLFAVVAVPVLVFGLRGVRPAAGPARGGGSWAPPVALLAVAAAFAALQLAECSQQIVVRRDPASYFNFATWLIHHGSLPIPQMRWAFGGGDPALSYGSPAFFQRGGVLVPQFMAGIPLMVAPAGWIAGAYGPLAAMPLIGALALVSFGGLTARLVGARWAPFAALALGLTWPMMMISRSIYSETGALILMLGGLSLVIDGVRAGRRLPALLGGLALGLTILVRIDGLRDVLPVVAFAGLLLALRRRTAPPLAAGLAVGGGAGLIEGFVMSRPYLELQRGSLVPLMYIAAAVLAGTVVMTMLVRWRGLPDLTRFRLPDLALPATFAVVALFAVRPVFQTVRRVPHSDDDRVNAAFIAALQKAEGLPLDPDRQYSELSLHWVAWYIGVPAVLLGAIGAGLLLRNLLRRRSPDWALPWAMIVWTTVTTLWRPAITPDQPWASRRLIQVVIPGMLLFALWAVAWAVRRGRRAGYGRRAGRIAARSATAAGALLIVVPAVITSAGMMFAPIEQGELAQTRALCRAIGPKASVVIVERVTADRFTQLIRGMCGTPAARVRPAPGSDTAAYADVRRIVGKVRVAGRRPVLLGADAEDVAPYGTPVHAFRVQTRRDASDLVNAPSGTWPLTINVWLAHPAYTG